VAKAGIELIVFENREREDLDGVLKDCASAGYDSVETGFLFELYTPEQLKEACEKYNLEYAAAHGGYPHIADEVYVDKLIENTVAAGGSYLICSGVAEGEGLDGFKKSVPVFNRVGKKCKEAGLMFCYHNHCGEFKPINGISCMDILGTETDPDLVKFNVDVAWIHIGRRLYGGPSPAEFIEQYKDRCGYYHFKDAYLESDDETKIDWSGIWTELGKGEVPLKETFETMENNASYIIYEQDRTQIDVMTAITESREYLKSLGI